jgi:hypothetical protein
LNLLSPDGFVEGAQAGSVGMVRGIEERGGVFTERESEVAIGGIDVPEGAEVHGDFVGEGSPGSGVLVGYPGWASPHVRRPGAKDRYPFAKVSAEVVQNVVVDDGVLQAIRRGGAEEHIGTHGFPIDQIPGSAEGRHKVLVAAEVVVVPAGLGELVDLLPIHSLYDMVVEEALQGFAIAGDEVLLGIDWESRLGNGRNLGSWRLHRVSLLRLGLRGEDIRIPFHKIRILLRPSHGFLHEFQSHLPGEITGANASLNRDGGRLSLGKGGFRKGSEHLLTLRRLDRKPVYHVTKGIHFFRVGILQGGKLTLNLL